MYDYFIGIGVAMLLLFEYTRNKAAANDKKQAKKRRLRTSSPLNTRK